MRITPTYHSVSIRSSVPTPKRMGAYVINTVTGGVTATDAMTDLLSSKVKQSDRFFSLYPDCYRPKDKKTGLPLYYGEVVQHSHRGYIPAGCPTPSGLFHAYHAQTYLKDSSTLTPHDLMLMLKGILEVQSVNRNIHRTVTTGMDSAAQVGALVGFFTPWSKRAVLSVAYNPARHPDGSDVKANREYAHYLAASDDFPYSGSYLVLAEPHLGAKIYSGVRVAHLGAKPSKMYKRDYFGGAKTSEIGTIDTKGHITVYAPYRKAYHRLINSAEVMQYEQELARYYEHLKVDQHERIQLPHVQEWRVTAHTSDDALQVIEHSLLAQQKQHPQRIAAMFYSSTVIPPREGELDPTNITTTHRQIERLKAFCQQHEIPFHVLFEKDALPMMPAAATSKLQLLTSMAYTLHPDAGYAKHQQYIHQWMNTNLRGEGAVHHVEATEQMPTRLKSAEVPLLIGNTSVTAEQIKAFRPLLLKTKQPLTIVGMGNGHLPVVGNDIEVQMQEACKTAGKEVIWQAFKEENGKALFTLKPFLNYVYRHDREHLGTIVAKSHPVLEALHDLIQEGVTVNMLPGPSRDVKANLTDYDPGLLLYAIGVRTPILAFRQQAHTPFYDTHELATPHKHKDAGLQGAFPSPQYFLEKYAPVSAQSH
ncbi:MAG: hypothetical protein ACKO37_00185 [Vampirovibrionales bacterium]